MAPSTPAPKQHLWGTGQVFFMTDAICLKVVNVAHYNRASKVLRMFTDLEVLKLH